MALTGLSVFLGAFLLFLVQPIIAKLILPRFGGSVAVWATCLVFFQAALLLGYAFAHQLVRRDASRAWRWAHVALLLASLALLPIVPVRLWPGSQQAEPALQILGLLLLTIGLPFTLLAMTSPLLQAWLAAARPPRNPYRLFAVSNGASLAALLAYPWLIEPWLHTATQAVLWSAAYALYVLALCAISLRRPISAAAAAASAAPPPGAARTLSWFALAALGSYALVALTNHLTQNIPSFPMMWVLPLVIYLLSFTLAFDTDRWTSPRVWRAAALLALAAMCLLLLHERRVGHIAWEIGGFLLGLFAVCMYCHGELARSRPAPALLTHFYLAVSAGGVAGGALVALAAPALLRGYFEVEIGLVLLAAAVLWRSIADLRAARSGIRPSGGRAGSWHQGRAWAAAAAAAVVLLGSALTLVMRVDEALSEVTAIGRNFYGVLRVREYGRDDPDAHERVLIHGTVMHGQQFLAPQFLRRPTSYYTPNSGVGRLLRALDDRTIEVGAVGLGAGTIAAYGKAGDRYRFYEIDDAIVRAAHRHFSFIADSPATVEVAVGDGRLLLQQEAERRFDVLVVDAFSGDSIPVHLLTREAVQLYRQRLAPGGVIALHLSNSHLELAPVAGRIAEEIGLQAVLIADPGVAGDPSTAVSDWVLLAEDREVLELPPIREAAQPVPQRAGLRTWTDDYSNILQVLSFGRGGG
ncbi:MAG TPA: fused MFS/spermidine synthase [Rubrivivax sp.]|nr:fused MFS/spermidine synthase [Rubrivivax sp.]